MASRRPDIDRSPRSKLYDGRIYAWVMDPLLAGLHDLVAKHVGAGVRVLEVGCGTGDLSFRMANAATEVVGVELSPAMVDFAQRRLEAESHTNLSFVLGDAATVLAGEPDGAFDVATMVMALHEMPAECRGPVLLEATRLAREVVCVDFLVPMPRNLAGMRNRFFELAAGVEHFRAFRDFVRRGGTRGIAESARLRYERVRPVDAGTLEIARIQR